MQRRRFLLSAGTLVGGVVTAGCAGSSTDDTTTEEPTPTTGTPEETPTAVPDPETPTPKPTPQGPPETYSQRFGIIAGDYYRLGAQDGSRFELSWTATITDETPGPFDVFLFTTEQYANYQELVDGSDGELSFIDAGSVQGIDTTATRTVRLDPGLYSLVVDNTRLGAATGAVAEERLEITLEAEMRSL